MVLGSLLFGFSSVMEMGFVGIECRSMVNRDLKPINVFVQMDWDPGPNPVETNVYS